MSDVVVDPADAPKSENNMLPQNSPEVFDQDVFQKEMRQRATVQLWEKMVIAESQARTLQTNGVVDVQRRNENDQIEVGSTVIDENLRNEAIQVQTQEAERLRRVVTQMLKANKVDELSLITSRISVLNQFKSAWVQELAVHRDFVEHPDHYGYVQLDGTTPINVEESTMSVKVLEAKLADIDSELDYYQSKMT